MLRGMLSVLLLLTGVALVGVGVPTLWVDRHVYDTDRWTAAVAPLIAEPAVQDDVAEALGRPLADELSLDGVLEDVLLRATREVVATDAFARVWERSVRVSHRHALEGLRGQGTGLNLVEDGVVVERSALIDVLRQELTAVGVPFADRIPDGQGTVVIARGPDVARGLTVARAVDTVGSWALVAGGVVLLLGVLVARHRPRALAVAGIGTLGVALALWLVLSVGLRGTGLVTEVDDRRQTALLVWEALSAPLVPMLEVTMAVGGAVAVVGVAAWLVRGARGHGRTRRNA